jgi:hypothetical protein
MTTPWTPPGAELPEPTPAPSTPPPLPKYPTAPPVFHGYPAGGGRPVGPPPSKTMAGWALGLAVFGCSIITWLVGVILAIQVLVESRREKRDHGTKLAIAALVVLAGWAVVAVLVVASGTLGRLDLREGMDQADNVDGGRVAPSRLEVGDCLDDPTLEDVPDDGDIVDAGLVTVIACERPHDLEAFLASDLLGNDYPGLDDLRRRAAEACDPAFKAYVGKALGRSELAYWVYYPTKRAWDAQADHRITCVVGSPGRKTSGTVQDSRR